MAFDWGGFFAALGDGIVAVAGATQFRNFLLQDRDTQMIQVEQRMRVMTQDMFNNFEMEYLQYASHLIEPNLKIRAMEIYSYFKFLEAVYLNHGKWAGFLNNTALAHRAQA